MTGFEGVVGLKRIVSKVSMVNVSFLSELHQLSVTIKKLEKT